MAFVEVPPDALIRVNGEARPIEGGRLGLSGRAGDVFDVELTREGIREMVRIVMTSDGRAEPARIDLAAAPKSAAPAAPQPRPGSRTKRPGSSPSAAAASPASSPTAPATSVKPVDTW
jgi:hypothetical protein